MADQEVKVRITSDATDAIAGFDKFNRKMKETHSDSVGLVAGIKKHWLELTAAGASVAAAWVTASKAIDLMKLGADAQQAEESFRQVGATAGYTAEQMDDYREAMSKASAGTVDDSDAMQKAVKGMALGLKPDEIVRLMEAARRGARLTGEDVKTAYEKITDAIATGMPKALKQYGLATTEEVSIVKAAVKAGVEDVNLLEIALKNAAIQAEKMGTLSVTSAEKIQIFNAKINDAKEQLGIMGLTIIDGLMPAMDLLDKELAKDAGATWGKKFVLALIPIEAEIYRLAMLLDKLGGTVTSAQMLLYGPGRAMGVESSTKRFEAAADANMMYQKRYEESDAALVKLAQKETQLEAELAGGGRKAAGGGADKAAQERIKVLEADRKALEDRLKAQTAAKSGKQSPAERETERIVEATRKATYELETIGQIQYEKDIARITSEALKYREAGADKIKVAEWVATETALADAKNTDAMFKTWRSASEAAVGDMMKDIDAGVKQTQDSLKKISNYNEMMGKEEAFTLDPHQDAINRVLEAEREKFAVMEDMRARNLISEEQYEKDKVLLAQNSAEEIAKINADLYQRQLNDVSAGFGDLSTAFEGISKMYAEGSEDAKRWQEAADAMLIAQKAVAVVQAVVAIATQGSGDPYTAFARIAAMAAAMGALLATIGESVNGSGAAAAAAPKTYNYGGDAGPLGAESGTASESLMNSMELLQDTYDMEDTQLTKIYNELRSLNDNITGLVSSIFRTGGLTTEGWGLKTGTFEDGTAYSSPFGSVNSKLGAVSMLGGDLIGMSTVAGLTNSITSLVNGELSAKQVFASSMQGWLDTSFMMMGDWLSYAIGSDKIAENFANALFGGKTEVELKKGGIEFADVLVKSVLDGMSVSARQFARYKITKDGGWFGSDDVSYKTKYAALDDDVVRMLTKVFDNLGGSLVELSKSLGTDVQDVYNYVFKTTQLNLKGMDAEEMSKALSDYFSKIADTAASDLFGTLIKEYQQVNEALFETAVRLVQDKEIISKVLEYTNQSFNTVDTSTVKTRQILNNAWVEWDKQQDTLAYKMKAFAANASKEMYEALGQELPDDLKKVLDSLAEPTKYLTETYVETTGKVIALTESLIEMAGGLEELTDAFQTYYDAFFSDAEKQADIKKQLMEGLGQYGFELPGQREDYRALVESLNLTTEAGQAAYVALMQMSESADQYYEYLEDEKDKAKSAIKESDYATRAEYLRAVKGYAAGGSFAGGIRIVGELGPEIEYTGPSYISSTQDSRKALGTDDVIAQVQKLSEEISRANFNAASGMPVYVNVMQMPMSSDSYYERMEKERESLKESESATRAEYVRDVRGYAAGGSFAGGIRVVGETGPEIEYTGPSYISSTQDSRKALGTDEMIAEVQKLRAEVGEANFKSAVLEQKLYKLLDKWDGEGIPAERT